MPEDVHARFTYTDKLPYEHSHVYCDRAVHQVRKAFKAKASILRVDSPTSELLCGHVNYGRVGHGSKKLGSSGGSGLPLPVRSLQTSVCRNRLSHGMGEFRLGSLECLIEALLQQSESKNQCAKVFGDTRRLVEACSRLVRSRLLKLQEYLAIWI